MRLDKFLKKSRVLKRRTLAHDACERQKVTINGKIAKPGSTVQEGDIVEIRFGENTVRFRVKRIAEHARKEEAGEMIEIL